MISLFFLTLALVATCIYFWRNRRTKEAHNRNRFSEKKRIVPEKLSEALITEQLCQNSDENVREILQEITEADPLMQVTNASDQPVSQMQRLLEEPGHIISVYLIAKEGESYSGYELLQALLSAGLRFGHQKIFHRHAHKDGRGEVLFHCAAANPPGTFDLSKMGSFTGNGLCLFFSSNEVQEPLAAFGCLMETLDQLVDDLGGKVYDENRTLFTKEKMYAHWEALRVLEQEKMDSCV